MLLFSEQMVVILTLHTCERRK